MVNVTSVFARCEHAGVHLSLSRGVIAARGRPTALRYVQPIIQQYRPAIIHQLEEEAREDLVDAYYERAAIAEYDGGISREDSEHVALNEVFLMVCEQRGIVPCDELAAPLLCELMERCMCEEMNHGQ